MEAANNNQNHRLSIRVTHEQYGQAVLKLLNLALDNPGTSGARAASQVLLSTYNGDEFHLDATDLCVLDEDHLAAAIAVLAGRAQLSREPHSFLKNGDQLFEQLWRQSERLSVSKRYAEHYRRS